MWRRRPFVPMVLRPFRDRAAHQPKRGNKLLVEHLEVVPRKPGGYELGIILLLQGSLCLSFICCILRLCNFYSGKRHNAPIRRITIVTSNQSMIRAQLYMSLPLPFMDTPLFLNERPAAKRAPSRSEATVNTPPTIAQVLLRKGVIIWTQQVKLIKKTYEVMKCANDCRISAWTTNIGEISKLKNAPGSPWTPC